MPPTPDDGDNPAPILPDGLWPAGHARARHDGGPAPVGWARGPLSDRATRLLHGAAVGHTVVGVRSSASVPARGCLLAGDAVVVTTAGQHPHGLDRFWARLYGKPVPGLACFT
jgi:hypothetical protein